MIVEPGRLVAGRYKLLRPLAKGGMGSVWVARHAELRSKVAIKFIDTELSERSTATRRFKREARAAAGLNSPHITRI
jgi:serine/threonine-protein kinase